MYFTILRFKVALYILMTSQFSFAAFMHVENTGDWMVTNIPQMTIDAYVELGALDISPDGSLFAEYEVKNFKINLNGQFGNKIFNDITLISNPSDSYLRVSPSINSSLGELQFYGSFDSNFNTFSNGNTAKEYSFRMYFDVIEDYTLESLAVPLNYDHTRGYISTLGGIYAAEVWNSDASVTFVAPVPIPSSFWLFASAICFLFLVNFHSYVYETVKLNDKNVF